MLDEQTIIRMLLQANQRGRDGYRIADVEVKNGFFKTGIEITYSKWRQIQE